MEPYRCYLFDAEGHIVKVETVESTSDAEALQWAENLCQRLPVRCKKVEVWRRSQFIGTRHRA